MGCVPTFDNFSENSNAPHKLKLSAKPRILPYLIYNIQLNRLF